MRGKEKPEDTFRRFQELSKKYENVSKLAYTAKDHEAIGSTPLQKMIDNPDKTQADLMTDEEILEYLEKFDGQIKRYSSPEYQNDQLAQDLLPTLHKELKLAVEYLRSISRLPEKFKNRTFDS